MIKPQLVGILYVLLLAGCGGGGRSSLPEPPEPPPPPGPRELILPADGLAGWSTAVVENSTRAELEQIIDDIEGGAFPTLDGLAIAHQGDLILDLTFRNELDRMDDDVGNANLRVHSLMSVTKSLAALLVGVAIEQGDLPAPSAPYLPLFGDMTFLNPSPEKDAVTLHDVLSFRIGLDWNERQPPYSSPDNQLNRFLRDAFDYTQDLFDLPMAGVAGEQYAYTTPATTTLGEAIQRNQPLALEDYAGTYLFLPLAVATAEVMRTPTGLPDLGRGLFLTARDLLKFGQIVLDEGRWDGQQVVPSDWIASMLTPYTEFAWADPEPWAWQVRGYGYQWWLGDIELDGVVYTAHAARGFGDQLLIVIEEAELVVAITGHAYDTHSDEQDLFDLVARRILPLMLETP